MADDELTIDELALRTGMTVRNIRAHQSRGLLPAPRLRGRTGLYGTDHVARIELIRDLQLEGFNLEGIRKLIEGSGSEDMLRFTRAVRAPFNAADAEATLTRAGEELRALGVPPETVVELVGQMRGGSERLADAFVALFLEQVWKPFDAAGRPAERWPAVQEALDRLRPLAAEAAEAIFGLVMTERVEAVLGEQLTRE